MMLNGYTIFDNKALTYSPPFFTNTDGSAIRMLRDLVAEGNNNVGRHPGDFVLYCCGTFSDANASMDAISPLRHIVDAIALVPPHTNDLFIPSPRKANGLEVEETI